MIRSCVFGLLAIGLPAAAQVNHTVRVDNVGIAGPVGITAALAGSVATVSGAPYSAQAVTERVQTLADGNRIVQNSTGTVARDGQGRVRRDESLPVLGKSGGEPPHLVFIEDPVAGVHWNLDPSSKTAFKMNVVRAQAANKTGGGPAVLANTITAAPSSVPSLPAVDAVPALSLTVLPPDLHFNAKVVHDNAQVSRSDLGTQTIEGVVAQGTRTTRTIAAGEVGNEQPLVITTETWYSPELKVFVMSKTNDPRMGETTYKLTDLQRAEPSPELFQVPSDYTLKDSPAPGVVFHKEIRKP